MGRIVKQPEVRRQEILDTAELLYGRKGYEQTSVQDIIDEVGIAKGTFYHYFPSKEALLEASIVRVVGQVVATLELLLADECLSALEKFNLVFSGGADIKLEYRSVLEPLGRFYFQEQGALMREKAQLETERLLTPVLGKIIRQGVDEGVFATAYATESAAIVLALSQQMGRALVPLFLAEKPGAEDVAQITAVVPAYEEAVTRVLGAAPGTIRLVRDDLYQRWREGQ